MAADAVRQGWLERAWEEREQLNHLADLLEEEFTERARPTEPGNGGLWHGAIIDIAADPDARFILILRVMNLLDHIRHNYPLKP